MTFLNRKFTLRPSKSQSYPPSYILVTNIKTHIFLDMMSGEARCPDKSDQNFCLNSVFTGCFANTSLGLRIVDCSSCFCQLRKKTKVRFLTQNLY